MQAQSEEIETLARALLKAQGYFVEKLWHVKDVHFICEQCELPRLSDEEAMEVFAIASQRFDGETGISWPQLEDAVRVFTSNRSAIAQIFADETL